MDGKSVLWVSPSFRWFACHLQCSLPCRRITQISAFIFTWHSPCICVQVLPFYKDSSHIGLAATAKSLQSCPTLCDPTDSSPPGSPVPGILQARTLEWVAISFSIVWKWKVKVKSFSRDRLVATPWTVAHQAPHPWDFPGKSTGVACHCLLHIGLEAHPNQFHLILTNYIII